MRFLLEYFRIGVKYVNDQIRKDQMMSELLINLICWAFGTKCLSKVNSFVCMNDVEVKFIEGHGYDGTLVVCGKRNGV